MENTANGELAAADETLVAQIAHKNKKGLCTYFCNRCRVSEIVANIANETPERIAAARVACTRCKGHNYDSPYWSEGEGIVHYDGAENGVSFAMAMADPLAMPKARRRNGNISKLSEETEKAVMTLLRIFQDLTRTQVLVMHTLLNGGGYTDAGRYAGISKQAANHAAMRAFAKHPALVSIAPHCAQIKDLDGVRLSLENRDRTNYYHYVKS